MCRWYPETLALQVTPAVQEAQKLSVCLTESKLASWTGQINKCANVKAYLKLVTCNPLMNHLPATTWDVHACAHTLWEWFIKVIKPAQESPHVNDLQKSVFMHTITCCNTMTAQKRCCTYRGMITVMSFLTIQTFQHRFEHRNLLFKRFSHFLLCLLTNWGQLM